MKTSTLHLKRSTVLLTVLIAIFHFTFINAQEFEKDVVPTEKGNIVISFIGHGTLMLEYQNLVIHIDPTTREANYSDMPDANLILITHQHGDHFDQSAIKQIETDESLIILTAVCAENAPDIKHKKVLKNGEQMNFKGIGIEAIAAYNIVHMRGENQPYHPKGEGNAYVLTMGDKRIFIGGDTENTPEMKALKQIDVAFLPMNLPYTMTPEMVADAAKAFKPVILYPYHFGNTDTGILLELMKVERDVEVRIRQMQ